MAYVFTKYFSTSLVTFYLRCSATQYPTDFHFRWIQSNRNDHAIRIFHGIFILFRNQFMRANPEDLGYATLDRPFCDLPHIDRKRMNQSIHRLDNHMNESFTYSAQPCFIIIILNPQFVVGIVIIINYILESIININRCFNVPNW